MMKTMPQRIQRKRTRGFKLSEVCTNPNGYVIVTRPTKYGNDFKVGDPDLIETDRPMTAEDATKYFEWALSYAPQEMIEEWKKELAGKDLACWCSLDSACHADVILRFVNPDLFQN